MIRCEGLQKRFGERTAVSDVAFEARDGAITGLLGPNGAGKTTTLRMVTTLVRPDAGRVEIDGMDAHADPLKARGRLAVLPDARGIAPRLTPREQARYFGELHGLDDATLNRNIERLVGRLGLEGIVDRRCEGFSQGERVKAALLRALVHDPKNVLLDEPTNGLDVMSTRALREFLRSLRSEGRCVVFSSHVMPEVAELCEHVVVIAAGRVIAQGSPEALRTQTESTTFEEAFVKLAGEGVSR